MSEKEEVYRVLARKYRPQNFDELIGQDALVRTLKNAIKSGRVAHAFMLTGVRGVGKTTTARIIAKALNYVGADGKSEATTGDTSDCPICKAISEDRHPDVIEMDAASRTGVDDIREILDGVRYAPTEARYKIYVIDEVHMLSKNAFNALLKTLEEPPEHVKFIFATTEIRKVPITVLSRCQRFDLQRVGVDILIPHFKSICEKEKFEVEEEAVATIARAADGSVRDGLSLLDQAMALSEGKITAEQVQDMLGLTDRAQNLDLLEKALEGETSKALEIMDSIYKSGGAPLVVIQDLLALTHLLTKLRVAPNIDGVNFVLSGDQLARAKEMAGKLSMPSLSKAWQILLKGLDEVNNAPNPQNAAEMIVIRLCYAANLPDPSDLVKKLKDGQSQTGGVAVAGQASPQSTGGQVHAQDFTSTPSQPIGGAVNIGGREMARATPELSIVDTPEAIPTLKNLEDVIEILRKNEEFLLAEQLFHFAHLTKIEHKNYGDKPSGLLEFRLEDEAMPDLSQNLTKVLKHITSQHWMVVMVNEQGEETLANIAEAKRLQELEEVAQLPLVKNILEIFPEAQLLKVMSKEDFDLDKNIT